MKVTYTDATGNTTYGLVKRKDDGHYWNTASAAFEAFDALNYADYDLSGTEDAGTGIYSFDFPAGVTEGGGYDLILKRQAGAGPVVGDAVIGEREVWWTGTAATAPPPPSASAEQVTAYLYVYDELGVVEPDVTIYCAASGFGDDEAAVALQYGFALDAAERSAVSDVNGLVQFTNLFKGVYYSFRRGSSGGYSAAIPADAADPYKLPSMIGEDA